MERWSSRTGFLLAAVGATVGLGNLWWFPAVVGRNGGGAYLVPYLLAVAVVAVPIVVLELAVGRDVRGDVVAAFRSVRPSFVGLGWLVVIVAVLLLSYYLVLTGWVLAFFVSFVGGETVSFDAFVAGNRPVVFFAAATLIAGGIVSLGVRDGIERLAKVAVPALALGLVGLLGYAATLDGFGRGLRYLLAPDVAVLADPGLWVAAVGQVLVSLAAGHGVMLSFGAYVDDRTDLVRAGLGIAAADVVLALVAGLVIFPIVFTAGMAPEVGVELAFVVLPEAFGSLPAGRTVGTALFGLVAVAAVTSAVGLLEVAVAAVMPATGLDRREATMGVTGVVVLVGLPSALSYSALDLTLAGRPILDVMDATIGALGLPVAAALIAVAFTWFQSDEAVDRQLPWRGLRVALAYAVPAALGALVVLRAVGLLDGAVLGRVPGRPGLGRPVVVATTVALLVAALGVGWLLGERLRDGGPRDGTR